MGYLYKLDFSSGKSYVGVTTKTISERMSGHRCHANGGRQHIVSRAWRKHGEPTVTVLAIASGDFLLEIERKAIFVYDTLSPNGYNATFGGDGVMAMTPEIKAKIAAKAIGRKVSFETREKLSLMRRGKKRKPHSDKAKEKMAAASRGRKASIETRAKLSAKIYTLETRAKMSLSAKGRVFTEEHKARISAALVGRKFSQEHCANISKRIRSPEHCAAISSGKRGKPIPGMSLIKWKQQNAVQHWAYGVGSPLFTLR